jgi:electron-transferring-flavoprotein dehydrogenase
VGAGPAGLSAACRLGQLARSSGEGLSVCLLEKGAAVGSHIVSGALFESRALDELFPDWPSQGAPVTIGVTEERFSWLLDSQRSRRVPNLFLPRSLSNESNFVISLGDLCQWLAQRAETLGCHIFTASAAVEVLFDADRVVGVATGDKGLSGDGSEKARFERGYDLLARHVIFAEGCRGNLMSRLTEKFDLRRDCDPQHHGIGFKEVWQIDPARHRPGSVLHTVGWPLGKEADGGGFAYHADRGELSLGLVLSLDYKNPWLDPYEEFQRWKTHADIGRLLEGGTRIAYAARAVNKGGLQSLPRLGVPGGSVVGCDAGFLNPAKIRGTHTAMKTGMLAAEAVFDELGESATPTMSYAERVRHSWVWQELLAGRNMAPGISRYGPFWGGALACLEQNVLRSSLPITLHRRTRDRETLGYAREANRIRYPRPDGVLTFDRMSSVHLANTQHDEDQPCHLRLLDADRPLDYNLPEFAEPAQRYCPAGVYEIIEDHQGNVRFQINAANCIHCKTCDIKDPADNIRWVPPEGGSGPNYVRL